MTAQGSCCSKKLLECVSCPTISARVAHADFLSFPNLMYCQLRAVEPTGNALMPLELVRSVVRYKDWHILMPPLTISGRVEAQAEL
mmetsp:Transcript_24844/g.48374  ORF Transcript_24844/g.48374 Transcript_24844/m.48374 type:complete len:86 (-) Transcript_24844:191-448(-)